MIDTNDFLCVLKHARCEAGLEESIDIQAIKLDDNDGLAIAIGFHPAMVCKADYFMHLGETIKFIELSDLEESAVKCHEILQRLIKKKQEELGLDELPTRLMRPLRKKAWLELTREFKNKWGGSIAVIERLLRRNNIQYDPTYRLIIVCKNKTEVNILDDLKCQLQGMMGNVEVCNTNTVARYMR
ncbi:hypothetical protein [Photobacterium damselae]|uniref:hypothetical protein n=1 Tax=Photobacterium damselae TaxID=38293 RepID=UPI00130268F4|nr:hypothetical protein [Photobacterium damselae]